MSSSSSWFGMAPRPSTPTINRSFSNGSTPGSPMRLPRIERVPSLEAVERSSHNDSGHGKSTLQIIKELKASNSKLSAKQADTEAEYMNKVAKLEKQFSKKEVELKDSLKSKESKIKSMESRIQTTETRIREKDVQLSEFKEETTFQRHTIADLKNQLYQLQHEIEDVEYEKRDGVDKWSAEKKEMELKLEQLEDQLACLSNNDSASNENDRPDTRQSEKSLENIVKELDETKKRLHDTQSALTNLRNETKQLRKEHEEREEELVVKIKSFDGDNSVVQELKNDLLDREKKIGELTGELKKSSTTLAELTIELEEVKANSHSQNKYREEEAEDLRVLNHSLREEIDRLKLEMDEMGHDLDEKDEVVLQKNNELNELQSNLLMVTKELKESKELFRSKDEKRVEDTTAELNSSRNENQQLRSELNSVTRKNSELIDRLRKEIQALTIERDDFSSKFEDAKMTRDEALSSIEIKGREDESRAEKRLREIVANAARERSELENVYKTKVSSLEQEYETKVLKITNQKGGNKQVEVMQNELKEQASEIQILRQEAENDAREQNVLLIELQKARERIRVFESKKAGNDRAKKQLREAQIALVALDDEKTLSDRQHKETIVALEKRIKLLELEHKEKLENKNLTGQMAQITKLKAELREKEILLRAERSKAVLNVEVEPLEDSVHEKLRGARETIQELRTSLSASQMQKDDAQKKLKEKLDDRDTTISALVKSSVSQEKKAAEMKAEILDLKSKLGKATSSGEPEAILATENIDHMEEIEKLKAQVEKYKQEDSSLVQHLEALEIKMKDIQQENAKLKDLHATAVSGLNTQEYQEKIQERDSAIATLVQQSMSLEEQLSHMESENSRLKVENEAISKGIKHHSGPTWGEMRRLQQESEIFASQIIEQDEEMETLRNRADERATKILELEKELASTKRKASSRDRNMHRFEDMQAEMDEMQEANDTHRSEIRDLRKQLRESKTHKNEVLDLHAELEQAKYTLAETKRKLAFTSEEEMKLHDEIDAARDAREDIEYKLNQRIDSIRRQMNDTVLVLEEKIKDRDITIEKLRSNEETFELRNEIQLLSKKLFEKADMLEKSRILNDELEEKLNKSEGAEKQRELEREKHVLEREVDELQELLRSTETDRANVEVIKGQLQSANDEKHEIESKIISSYERKLSLLRLDKDVTIDNLRKELAEAKSKISGRSDNLRRELVDLEQENADVRYEFEAKLHLKNTKIHGLEQTLEAREQLVDNMRAEMDQLQNTMERTSLSRRAEIEEMQQEMIDTSSRAQKQEREITSLKMALEESRLERKSEVSKLKNQLDAMANVNHLSENKASNAILDDVKERLENFKWRNTSLQEENVKLRNRLVRVERECEIVRAENDDSAAKSKTQVIQLRERVQELEELNKSKRTNVEKANAQHRKPPHPESNGGRSNSKVPPSPKQRSGGLRFLKRKNSKGKEVTNIEKKKPLAITADGNSISTKNTF